MNFTDFFLLHPEIKDFPKLNTKEKKEFGLQLIAIQVSSIDSSTEDSSPNRILINPTNHIITKDDIGYVIAVDQESSEEISSLSNESPGYFNYIYNMNTMKKVSDNILEKTGRNSSDLINTIYENLETNYSNWRINDDKWRNNGTQPSMAGFDEKPEKIPSFFNLFHDVTPKGLFKNHLIVKGNLNEVQNIAHIVRFYSERPILLFTDQKINQSVWAKLKASYSNIYCVFGNPMLVKHVEQLNPKKAYKVLILSSSNDELIQDSSNVIFTRILVDFFETSNILVELLDENSMRFISAKPRITLDNRLDYFFWPMFVRGSVHFSSLIMSILARALYNKYWVDFLKNLAQPKESELSLQFQSEDFENSSILSFEITKEIIKEVKIYGQLQYLLMNSSQPMMAIAVLKEKSYAGNKNINQIARGGGDLLKGMLAAHFLKTMDDLYSYSYVMTNPSFMTELEIGNKVLVMGSLNKRIDKRHLSVKETKIIPKIKVYLNKKSIDIGNFKKKEEESKNIRIFFRDRKKIWKSNQRRMGYKVNLMNLLNETNNMIRFTLENYKNVFKDEEEDDEDEEDF